MAKLTISMNIEGHESIWVIDEPEEVILKSRAVRAYLGTPTRTIRHEGAVSPWDLAVMLQVDREARNA